MAYFAPLCFLLLAVLLVLADAGCPNPSSCPSNSCNPCHPKEARPRSTCDLVRLPHGMCVQCALKKPKADGTFYDATSIYDTRSVGCRRRLKRYARMNTCDSERITPASVNKARMGDKGEQEKIDYLLYSLCEECCDCIPKGTPKSDLGALSLVRGNCPAHAHYDICRIHPKMKWIVKGKATAVPDLNTLPEVCDDIQAWSKSEHFPGWAKNQNVVINDNIKKILNATLQAVQCTRPAVWNKCFDLEHAQERVR